jgi:hypothetical protein
MAPITHRGVGRAILQENGGEETINGVRIINKTEEPATVTFEPLGHRAKHLHVELDHTQEDLYFGMRVRTVVIQSQNNGIAFHCLWPERQNNA